MQRWLFIIDIVNNLQNHLSTSKFYQLPQEIKEMITANTQRIRFPLLKVRMFCKVDHLNFLGKYSGCCRKPQ